MEEATQCPPWFLELSIFFLGSVINLLSCLPNLFLFSYLSITSPFTLQFHCKPPLNLLQAGTPNLDSRPGTIGIASYSLSLLAGPIYLLDSGSCVPPPHWSGHSIVPCPLGETRNSEAGQKRGTTRLWLNLRAG